jgi:hypothetical protein
MFFLLKLFFSISRKYAKNYIQLIKNTQVITHLLMRILKLKSTVFLKNDSFYCVIRPNATVPEIFSIFAFTVAPLIAPGI